MRDAALVPRPLSPVAETMSITVPEDVGTLQSSMSALGGAINAGGWATAAVVYAWTEPGEGGPRTGGKSSQLSMREFAELGIRGLTDRATVGRYRAAWERAVERGWASEAKRGQPVRLPDRDFKETEEHVAQNSGEIEWYTPLDYIEAARRVMGGIDLDPASNALANEGIKATTFYTAKENGLTQPWFGRVWMNPPYSSKLVYAFCERLCEVYSDGEIEQAIVLVNNATETAHFQRMAEVAAAICFHARRIEFWHPEREDTAAGLQGQAFLYFGPDLDAFTAEFVAFGFVVTL